MPDFLEQMAANSRARAKATKLCLSAADFDKPVYPLTLSEFDLIAEIKDRSPAEGELTAAAGGRADRARTYAAAGAAAISVLTEPERFSGALSHLEEVVAAVSDQQIPVMRKDFIVDVVQVLEARAAGASGVLLITAISNDDELVCLLDCAFEHNLFVLLESFDESDVRRSVRLLDVPTYRQQAVDNKLLFGINSRDLRTLAVDPTRLERLGAELPDGIACVAESGQHTAEDATRVANYGYCAALVGTALMRAADPGELIQDMVTAGRLARA